MRDKVRILSRRGEAARGVISRGRPDIAGPITVARPSCFGRCLSSRRAWVVPHKTGSRIKGAPPLAAETRQGRGFEFVCLPGSCWNTNPNSPRVSQEWACWCPNSVSRSLVLGPGRRTKDAGPRRRWRTHKAIRKEFHDVARLVNPLLKRWVVTGTAMIGIGWNTDLSQTGCSRWPMS